MRSRVLLAVVLVLLSGLQCGCIGNGPNPRETVGDHVAGVMDAVTSVVLYVPGVVLLGVFLLEQEVTALIRSDGGGRGPRPVPVAPECPEEPAVEFPPPTPEAAGAKSCD